MGEEEKRNQAKKSMTPVGSEWIWVSVGYKMDSKRRIQGKGRERKGESNENLRYEGRMEKE